MFAKGNGKDVLWSTYTLRITNSENFIRLTRQQMRAFRRGRGGGTLLALPEMWLDLPSTCALFLGIGKRKARVVYALQFGVFVQATNPKLTTNPRDTKTTT